MPTSALTRPPIVFVSYSWSSQEYVDKVVRFVQDLRRSGVEVRFDQLDLTEGQNKYHFMERMLSDPEVDRVLILCDPSYAEKADSKRAGVGAETLIITPEVYENAEQSRIIPVIMERENGLVRVPIYLRGSLYFDLSGPDRAFHFQRLVRRLHGRPDLEREPLGERPAYVDDTRPALRTGAALDIFIDTVDRGAKNPNLRLREFCGSLFDALGDLTAPPTDREAPTVADEWIVAAIADTEPYRAEYLRAVLYIADQDEPEPFLGELHRLFERLTAARLNRSLACYGNETDATPLGFVTREFFLYTVGALLDRGHVRATRVLFRPLQIASSAGASGTLLRSFSALDPTLRPLDVHRNHRLGLRSRSLSGSMMRERLADAGLPFDALVQADVVAWVRDALDPNEDRNWYPTLLAVSPNTEALPLFVRAARHTVFVELGALLGVRDAEELRTRLNAIPEGRLPEPDGFWGGKTRWHRLLRLDELDTRGEE